jgi:hypothetical protein
MYDKKQRTASHTSHDVLPHDDPPNHPHTITLKLYAQLVGF